MYETPLNKNFAIAQVMSSVDAARGYLQGGPEWNSLRAAWTLSGSTSGRRGCLTVWLVFTSLHFGEIPWEVLISEGWDEGEANTFDRELSRQFEETYRLGGHVCREDLYHEFPESRHYPIETPLWRYHPLRTLEAFPWGPEIARIGRRSKEVMLLGTMQELTNMFVDVYSEELTQIPVRKRRAFNNDSRDIIRYTELLLQVADFVHAGKQIFDFPGELLDLFRHTDVDDITLEDVKLPYPSIYLHFGPQQDVELKKGWFAEGAYLESPTTASGKRRAVNIVIVCKAASREEYLGFDQKLEPTHTAGFGPQHLKMALAEAVDEVLAARLNELKGEIENEPLRQYIEQARQEGEDISANAVSVQARNAARELEQLPAKQDALRKMLKLIVNGLVYLNAYPSDIETQWPSDAPRQLVEAFETATKWKEKRNAKSALAQAGFSAVHLCGQQLKEVLRRQQAERERATSAGETRSVALHWVRGHWRRQAYGPQNTLRKIIWRMPMLRGTRKGEGEDALGHIYLAT